MAKYSDSLYWLQFNIVFLFSSFETQDHLQAVVEGSLLGLCIEDSVTDRGNVKHSHEEKGIVINLKCNWLFPQTVL